MKVRVKMKDAITFAAPFPYDYSDCQLCPRQCRADRTQVFDGASSRNTANSQPVPGYTPTPDQALSAPHSIGITAAPPLGFCQSGPSPKIARAALHHWEEPCISGTCGSGTVFFSGCTLGCCFCQNHAISRENFGKEVTTKQLSAIFLRLQAQGAHNLNLVTPTHYLPSITSALRLAHPDLTIPVVYNCGGYERTSIIKALEPYVDVWLPDLKYHSPHLSARCSKAKDYFTQAARAIQQMVSQTGPPKLDRHGLLQSGVLIRHMVLPGHKDDSLKLLQWIKGALPQGCYRLSLLSQYTPSYLAKDTDDYPELNRKVTTYEYEKVVDYAIELGLTDGYMQKRTSAGDEYTPPFNLEGV